MRSKQPAPRGRVRHGPRQAARVRARPAPARRCCSCTVSPATGPPGTGLSRLLAKKYTVIAPDLLGHGLSDKPRADYTLGGYANGMRDLLTVLGIDKVTVVGHSFGGGIAMQFAYQYPERTQRVMLVSSGGLGPEVTPLIKLVQAPGWEAAMRVLTLPGIRHLETTALRALSSYGAGPLRKYTRDLDEAAAIVESWRDRRTRFAVRHLVRAVIDWRGQIVTMSDRAYLTEYDADGGRVGPGRPGPPGPALQQRGGTGAGRDRHRAARQRPLPAPRPPGGSTVRPRRHRSTSSAGRTTAAAARATTRARRDPLASARDAAANGHCATTAACQPAGRGRRRPRPA